MTPDRTPLPWQHSLTGAAIGGALAVFAAFLGEDRAPSALLLALPLLGAALSLWRPTRLLWQWGTGLLVLATVCCLVTPVLKRPLGDLTLRQPPVQADAIVVLGGGVQCSSRALDSASLARLIAGLKLWRAGYAPTMTVSEQSDLLGGPNCPRMSVLESEYVRGLYPHSGPELLTLRRVTTTRDEAARVQEIATQRGWKKILLVTSPSHSRRAQGIFASYGLDTVSVPAEELRYDEGLPLPSDRLYALRVLVYEGLSRLKARLGGTPER